MAGKDIIMMSKRELKRSHIIHKVLDKELEQVEAAEFLNLSDRQIWNIRLWRKEDSKESSEGRPDRCNTQVTR